MISEQIDLTEHQDFSRTMLRGSINIESRSFWDRIQESMLRERFGKFIWRVKDEQAPLPFDGIFPLGNKYLRQETLKMYYWGSKDAQHCDGCGKKIKIIPWKKHSGLCEMCNYTRRKKGEFPWI